MRITAFSTLALGIGLVSVQLSACGNSADDCTATATCGAAAGSSSAGTAGKSGGSGSGNDAGGPSGGSVSTGGSASTGGSSSMSGTTGTGGEGGSGTQACTGDVSDDASCWTTNELGVFVSSDAGDDDKGDGTQQAPFKTIGKGITASAGKNVYVCVGANDYSEQISLDATTDGVRLYGGFECATWTYATTRSVQVTSPKNIALRIASVKKGVYIENIGFTAADATGDGLDASSYGAFVTGSKNVVFKRVELLAGAGAKGASSKASGKGADGATPTMDQNGKPGLCGGTPDDAVGGKWTGPTCGSRGGNGGDGVLNSSGASGLSGTPGLSVTPPNIVNLGAGSSDATHGGDGTDGSTGDAGVVAASAANAGTFAKDGFTAADGHDGTIGFPGQGGGGGGASKGTATCRGASGGAGGMGGCGGLAGLRGGGGGASVGLLTWASDVALVASTIISVTGGNGGNGGNGGTGGGGAKGGDSGAAIPGNVTRGGSGGFGGDGGPGGSGSGGTGGPSCAIVYSVTKPMYGDDTMLEPGKGGGAGIGGQVTATAPNGSVGDSLDVFQVQ